MTAAIEARVVASQDHAAVARSIAAPPAAAAIQTRRTGQRGASAEATARTAAAAANQVRSPVRCRPVETNCEPTQTSSNTTAAAPGIHWAHNRSSLRNARTATVTTPTMTAMTNTEEMKDVSSATPASMPNGRRTMARTIHEPESSRPGRSRRAAAQTQVTDQATTVGFGWSRATSRPTRTPGSQAAARTVRSIAGRRSSCHSMSANPPTTATVAAHAAPSPGARAQAVA